MKGLLSYLAVFFCNGLLWWYFRSYFNFIIAILMIAGAVLSVALFRQSREQFCAQVVVSKNCMDKQGTASYAIRVTTNTKWGRFPAAVTYTLGNLFSGKKETEAFRTYTYEAKQGRDNFSRSFRPLFYGRYEIALEKCLVYDFFRLVYCMDCDRKNAWIMVAPSEDVGEEQSAEILRQHLPEETGRRRGLDYSADYELRDYQPGDDMKSIHWKLSARQGHLMVRERLSDGKPKVNLLLHPSQEQSDNDLRIELLNRIAKALLTSEYPIGVFWWNFRESAVRTVFVTSPEELELAIHEILSGNGLGKADGLMELFLQEHPNETALEIDQTQKTEAAEPQKQPKPLKQQKQQSDVVLLAEPKEKTLTFGGVLAKAVLITALVFGSLGGFLSAYDITYQNVFCLCVIFTVALVMGILYDWGRRIWINLGLIAFMIAFLTFVGRYYWHLNSGYHVILNEVFRDARRYLGIFDGTEFIINVENEYAAVTYFILFLALIEVVLFQMYFSRKLSLLRSVMMTFPVLMIPLYFEELPKTGFLLLLLCAYFAVALVCAGKVKKQLSGQIGYALLTAGLLAVGGGQLLMLLMPFGSYRKAIPANAVKQGSEEVIGSIVQFGLSTFLFASRGGGISGGMLSRGGSAMPDYETDLIVEYTPYSSAPVYLKAYIGKDYKGMRWTEDTDADFFGAETLDGLSELADAGCGKMSIENVGASKEYLYIPYYEDPTGRPLTGTKLMHRYYPYDDRLQIETKGVDDSYLTVPESCRQAVWKFCRDGDFSGSVEEIAGQVADYFEEHYAYTLNPGFMWRSNDFITNFLSYGKKGYCMHFASAAVMVFRNLGIPARYVEGYVFSYDEVLARGELVEDAAYGEYYQGYSELGETAVVRLEIPDANAHAWVEVYAPGKGWIVVDPTPSSSELEEGDDSFWDAFGDTGNDILDNGIFSPDTAAFLTKTIGNFFYFAFAAAIGAGIFWVIRWGYGRRMETLLPPKERLMLEYRRKVRRFARRYRTVSEADTIHRQLEQMALVRRHPLEPAEKELLEKQLYHVFYGGELKAAEYEHLRKELRKK